MIFTDKKEFLSHINAGKKLLGLDMGSKSIGVAVADLEMQIPTALKTLERKKFTHDLEEIKKLVKEYNIGGLVIGLPLSGDGTENKNCQSIRQFARNILKDLEIAIIFEDERLTTFAAGEEMKKVGLKAKQIAEIDDKIAAALILENFLAKGYEAN